MPLVKQKLCILSMDYFMEDVGSHEAVDKVGGGSEEGGSRGKVRPVIRIWGKTPEGKSVLVFDRGFLPYFYVEPKAGMSLEQLQDMAERLERVELDGHRPVRVEMDEMRYLSVPRKVFRVFVDRPSEVPRYRDAVKDWEDVREQYEYAVSFYKRYMIDKGLVPMEWIEAKGEVSKPGKGLLVDMVVEAESVKPVVGEKLPKMKVLAFDIETSEDPDGDRVIMISVADSGRFSKVLTYKGKRKAGVEVLKDEKAMLERFVKIVRERDPDVIVGYNTDRFDFVKLDARAEALKVNLDLSRDGSGVRFKRRMWTAAAHIKGRVNIDLYSFVDSIVKFSLSTGTLSLDMVAREILGKQKKGMKWKDIEETWKEGKDLRKLAEYCLWDSKLAFMLGKALLPQIWELSRVTGQIPFDTSRMRYSQLVEWLLMRRAHDIGEISPNRPRHEEIRKRRMYPAYTGGYVLSPVEGIHENLALFDFASLYPSITITHNISPETLNCMCCHEEGVCKGRVNKVPEGEHYFCKKHKGFIPSVLEDIIGQRQNVKRRLVRAKPGTLLYRMLDNRQKALKILANASYGYYAYAGSRWYSRVCAQSITAWGRHYIRKVIKMAERMKFEVIYGDTDSLFIKTKTKKAAREFLKKANSSLPGVMELEMEGTYKAGIFVLAKTGVAAKKRYALLGEDGKITIRGLEKVRRDWSLIARNTQAGVIEAILKDRSPEKAVKLVKGNIERIRSGEVGMNDLVIYSQITKPLSKYEQIGPHVVAARKAQERGRVIKAGTTIALIITKGEGSISSRAEPLEDARNYDPEYYIRNQLVPAALRILGGLGYSEEDLIGDGPGPSQSNLEGFFGKD